MPGETDEDGVIDETYLPFSREQLLRHFAPVVGTGSPDRWLTHYVNSVERARVFAEVGKVEPITKFIQMRRGRQIEKDERFWVVATLMALYEPEETRIEEFSSLLGKCLGTDPPFAEFDSWQEALGSSPQLFFEANLASPPDYRHDLQKYPGEHMLEIPYIKNAAAHVRGSRLEGQTHVDALLIAPDNGFTVLFEAKVLSDTSYLTEFDARRNQIARNIDVMLEKPSPRVFSPLKHRDPAKSCFVLITDELFKKHPDSRLYGWLMREYQKDAELLHRHLPHRDPKELETVPSRLGWLTWQDCNWVHPGACRWLPSASDAHA